ncbi:N-acetyltransferase [Limibaculum sp. M0105]|uniref:N-acetyltransferase n=1 Tax=Thermohalobaculum xanthum TaxID=2753746 RepID=A0A8J7SCP9_9RHOB|nr:N-acetyltransferase [Thermohalobaculum xanthum]MBK0398386.1 N-acetyltransferase [Thermohalobaculum xanthum]
MTESLEIRESDAGDRAAIDALYTAAFPEEDLLSLIADLLGRPDDVLSLVGLVGTEMVGHGIFTTCAVSGGDYRVALLGPLAVAPARQGQGTGTRIVRAGLQRLAGQGFSRVYVLGDPAYYRRFGFAPDAGVVPPCPIPSEWRGAWQSLGLGGNDQCLTGTLVVPRPWQRPELWAP